MRTQITERRTGRALTAAEAVRMPEDAYSLHTTCSEHNAAVVVRVRGTAEYAFCAGGCKWQRSFGERDRWIPLA